LGSRAEPGETEHKITRKNVKKIQCAYNELYRHQQFSAIPLKYFFTTPEDMLLC